MHTRPEPAPLVRAWGWGQKLNINKEPADGQRTSGHDYDSDQSDCATPSARPRVSVRRAGSTSQLPAPHLCPAHFRHKGADGGGGGGGGGATSGAEQAANKARGKQFGASCCPTSSIIGPAGRPSAKLIWRRPETLCEVGPQAGTGRARLANQLAASFDHLASRGGR